MAVTNENSQKPAKRQEIENMIALLLLHPEAVLQALRSNDPQSALVSLIDGLMESNA